MGTENAEVLRGTLDMLILKTLSLAPLHGWGICERIQQVSGDTLRVQQGSLYASLHRLTRDHTLGQQMALWGASNSDRFQHVLTRAIGIPGTGGDPDLRHYRLDDGDRLLLCTDGLTDMVDEEAIARELGRETSADDACRALIDLALENGGRDNVTAVVAGYGIGEGA